MTKIVYVTLASRFRIALSLFRKGLYLVYTPRNKQHQIT